MITFVALGLFLTAAGYATAAVKSEQTAAVDQWGHAAVYAFVACIVFVVAGGPLGYASAVVAAILSGLALVMRWLLLPDEEEEP